MCLTINAVVEVANIADGQSLALELHNASKKYRLPTGLRFAGQTPHDGPHAMACQSAPAFQPTSPEPFCFRLRPSISQIWQAPSVTF